MLIYQLIQHLRFLLANHLQRLMAAIMGALVIALCALQLGVLKPQIHWTDVAGEGTAALLALIWLTLLLCARPAGRVTTILFSGALLYWYASLLDLLDEFLAYPHQFRLFSDMESLAIPVAMLLVTIGLLEWLKEQKLINHQLKQRELIHREYQLLDPLTQLYSETYLLQQLKQLNSRGLARPSLFLFDIENFAQINQQQGMANGDQLLKRFAELMVSQLACDDLLCRCGGNKFALIFTQPISGDSKALVEAMLFEAIRQLQPSLSVRWVEVDWQQGQVPEALMEEANQKLAQLKQAQLIR